MFKYQQLYSEGASQNQIDDIKATLTANQVLTWEEYYWGTKCVVKYDGGDNNPKLVINSLRKAFRNGLSIHSYPETYQDALKTISAFYGITGKYEQVINYLMIYIDSMGSAAPDWAFHDILYAQIHTDQIELMIENPKTFLSELSRNDNLSSSVEERQKKLFRDFLFYACKFIEEHKNIKVDFESIKIAAEEYQLIDSEAWESFSVIARGCCKPQRKDKSQKQSKDTDVEKLSNPTNNQKQTVNNPSNVVSLFPEETTIEKAYEEKAGPPQEPERKNNELQSQLDKSQRMVSELQLKLSKLEEEYAKLREKLSKGVASEAALNSTISLLQDKLNIAHSDLNIAKRTIYEEKTRVAANKEDVTRLENEKEATIAKLLEISKKYNDAIKQINDLEYKLNTEETHISKITEEANTPSFEAIKDKISHFLDFPCLDAGKEWLKKKLPELSDDYMPDCFFPALSNDAAERAIYDGWTRIEDFDLYPILRVIRHNFYAIPSFIPSKEDASIIQRMIDIRHEWIGHFNGGEPTKKKITNDINTMSKFIRIMGGDSKVADEMRAYADRLQ